MPHTLLSDILEATAGEFETIAELGQANVGAAFLARELASEELVVLLRPRAAEELAVLTALGIDVPANAGTCATCGAPPPTWATACTRCSRRFAGVDDSSYTVANVQAACANVYDVIGSIAHEAGGRLFFARDLMDGQLIALTPSIGPAGEDLLEAVWASSPDMLLPKREGNSLSGYTAPENVAGKRSAPGERRWIPATLVGALALSVGGSWIWLKNAEPVGSTLPPTALATTVAGEGLMAPISPLTSTSGVDRSAESATSHAPDRAPAARASGSTARVHQSSPAFTTVEIEGPLPAGWSRSVNGTFVGAIRTVVLTTGHSALLRIEAPGYCPDTLRIRPSPGVTQHWTPELRGVNMAREC